MDAYKFLNERSAKRRVPELDQQVRLTMFQARGWGRATQPLPAALCRARD